MAGYRSAFIHSTRFLSAALSMKTMVCLTGQRLVVPVYHLVSDHTPLHIKHLYQAKSEKQFIKDLDFLLRHYQPVDLPALKDIVIYGKTIPGNVFILTFDDGLREFYDVIAPILVKKGIPAINFLNRDFVGNKDLFFRYKASLLIDRLCQDKALLKHEKVNAWMLEHGSRSANDYKQVLLNTGYAERQRLDQLAEYAGLDFKAYLEQEKPYMDAPQIKKLIEQGFYFGGHSNSHPEYRFIDQASQLRETIESVDYVQDTFQVPYRTFAFPFTDFEVGKTFFERLEKEGNMDISFGSAGLKNDPVPFHVQRIPLEMAGLGAEAVLKSEYVYYMIKSLFRKNTIHRS
jgi:peptidoglycan/xylan/chitin deacetylase (PgdA/CDA1 family)